MSINLKAERLNRGLNITTAAKGMKVPLNVLQRAESGGSVPQPRNAFKIADFYGYKVTEIWPIKDDPPPVKVGVVRKVKASAG